MRITRLILAGTLLVVLLVFVGQNLRFVGLHFLTWKLALPIALPVAVAYLLGASTGRILFSFLKRQAKELDHKRHPATAPRATTQG